MKRLTEGAAGAARATSLAVGTLVAPLTARSAAGDPDEHRMPSALLAQGDPHECVGQATLLAEYAHPRQPRFDRIPVRHPAWVPAIFGIAADLSTTWRKVVPPHRSPSKHAMRLVTPCRPGDRGSAFEPRWLSASPPLILQGGRSG